MDYFIERMKELGDASTGVSLVDWTNWLTLDMAADMAWNLKMHQMEHATSSVYLDALLAFNSFATVMQVFKRFPLLHLFQYLLAPFPKLKAFVAMEAATRQATLQRIASVGSTQHPDFFDHILPQGDPVPTSGRELVHLGSLGLQIMFANC